MICGVSLSQAAESIAPVINITPSESNVKAGDTIIVTVSDDSGLRNVSYKWATQSTSTILTDDVTGRQSVSIEVGQLGTTAGTYSLKVTAKDTYGNVNEQEYDFIIGSTSTKNDTTDPVITVTPGSGTLNSGDNVIVKVSDNETLARVSYRWGSKVAYAQFSNVAGKTSINKSLSVPTTSGNYVLYIQAEDKAGNISTMPSVYTVVTETNDKKAPDISITPSESEIKA